MYWKTEGPMPRQSCHVPEGKKALLAQRRILLGGTETEDTFSINFTQPLSPSLQSWITFAVIIDWCEWTLQGDLRGQSLHSLPPIATGTCPFPLGRMLKGCSFVNCSYRSRVTWLLFRCLFLYPLSISRSEITGGLSAVLVALPLA